MTLTGHIGSLREHIYAALVGAEKWPTFVLVDMSLSLRCDLCKCVRLCLPMCHLHQAFILQKI